MCNKYKKQNFIIVLSIILLVVHFKIFSGFFPNKNGFIGGDYSQFFPTLLDGYFWFSINGIFSPQWFTPSICGGVPKYANLEGLYYSVPQFFSFFFNPLTALKLTFISFSITGYISTFLLLKRSFKFPIETSLLGAVLFLFNGFFLQSMIFGHLTYHSFMLIPLLAYLFLDDKVSFKMSVSISSILIAYFVFAGAIDLIVPFMISIFILGIIHFLMFSNKKTFKLYSTKFTVASSIGFALCFSKILAALSYMKTFPRDFLPLPSIDGPFNLIQVIFKSLFFAPGDKWAIENLIYNNELMKGMSHLINEPILIQEEFEYGIGMVPLILVFIYLAKCFKQKNFKIIGTKNKSLKILLTIVLLIPYLLNIYHPLWDSILKTIPYIKNSSVLFRWFSIYIPTLILFSCIALERLNLKKRNKQIVIYTSVLITCITAIVHERSYYEGQMYDPRAILTSFKSVKSGTPIPQINKIGLNLPTGTKVSSNDFFKNLDVELVDEEKIKLFWEKVNTSDNWDMNRNNLFTVGASQIMCHETMFGYNNEKYPINKLHPDYVYKLADNHFNMKNPACYVFPKENNCFPGEHFKINDRKNLTRFINYESFNFKQSQFQKIANTISLSVLLIVFAIIFYELLFFGIRSLRRIVVN